MRKQPYILAYIYTAKKMEKTMKNGKHDFRYEDFIRKRTYFTSENLQVFFGKIDAFNMQVYFFSMIPSLVLC